MAKKAIRTAESIDPPAGAERILEPSDPEATELLSLAGQVKTLAPWRWMEETDLIGIENPETGEIGFISVMGSVGEYEAVALYLGAEGFYGFRDISEDDTATADRILETPQLQAAFSERKYLDKRDRDLIKQSGLKFGAKAWPMFRSYRSGYLPWFITIPEARFLIHALSQILEVARRVRDEDQPFHPTGRIEKGGYLMRVSRKEGLQLVWEDQVWQIPKPKRESVSSVVDAQVLDALPRLSTSKLDFEVDLLRLPASISEPEKRPVAVYALMAADSESGFIFGFDVLTAEDSMAAMYARIPGKLAEIFSKNQMLPGCVTVRSERLRVLLKPLTQSLNIALRFADELPSIDEADSALDDWLQQGNS